MLTIRGMEFGTESKERELQRERNRGFERYWVSLRIPLYLYQSVRGRGERSHTHWDGWYGVCAMQQCRAEEPCTLGDSRL